MYNIDFIQLDRLYIYIIYKHTVWVAIDSFFIWIVHVDMWHAAMDPILQFLPIGHEIGWCVYFFW